MSGCGRPVPFFFAESQQGDGLRQLAALDSGESQGRVGQLAIVPFLLDTWNFFHSRPAGHSTICPGTGLIGDAFQAARNCFAVFSPWPLGKAHKYYGELPATHSE